MEYKKEPFTITNKATIYLTAETQQRVAALVAARTEEEAFTNGDGEQVTLYRYPTIGQLFAELVAGAHG